MDINKIMGKVEAEIKKVLSGIKAKDTEKLIDHILNAKNIFIVGQGRSGLMGRAFAMRLMHLGLRAYVVGEIVTPAIQGGDFLIAISGSGENQVT